MPSPPRRRLEWSPAAREEFRDILRYYTRQFSDEAAERVRAQIQTSIRRLIDFPHLGPAAGGLDLSRRRLQVGNYTVLYRVVPERLAVRIIGVRHGRRRPLSPAEIAAMDDES